MSQRWDPKADLNKVLAQQLEEKRLREALAGGGQQQQQSVGNARGAGGGGGSGGGVDQAARDREFAANLAERARSQKADSDNRMAEDTNRSNLQDQSLEKKRAAALALMAATR